MADTEQTTEERISALEREVIELRLQLKQLLAEQRPTEDFRAELTRVRKLVVEFSEREEAHEDYMRARLGVVDFDLRSLDNDVKNLRTDVKNLQTDVKNLQTGQQEIHAEIQELREEMRNGFQDLRLAQQELGAGMHHILEFLIGKSKMND